MLVGERRGERCGEGMKREGEGERRRRRTLVALVDEEDGDRLRDRVLVRGPLRRLLGWWRRARLRLRLCRVGLGERRHRHATYAVLLVSRYYIKDNNLRSMSCSTRQPGSTGSIYQLPHHLFNSSSPPMRLSRSNRMCQAVHEENSSSVALVPGSKMPAARLAECLAESMVLREAAETPPF